MVIGVPNEVLENAKIAAAGGGFQLNSHYPEICDSVKL